MKCGLVVWHFVAGLTRFTYYEHCNNDMFKEKIDENSVIAFSSVCMKRRV